MTFVFTILFLTCMMIVRYDMIHDPDMYHNIRRFLKKDEEISAFGKWAFADMYESLNCLQCMLAWNQLHGDKLELNPHNLMKDTLPKMIKIWRQENGKSNV